MKRAANMDGEKGVHDKSQSRTMDRLSAKRSKKFNPDKILAKVRLKIQLSARLKEAADAFLKVAVEVVESPHSTTILQEMESVYKDLTLQGYFGLKCLKALQIAIKSVPTSFCCARDDYIVNISTLFLAANGHPAPHDVVKRTIPFLEEDCNFQKSYLDAVKQYSIQVYIYST